MKRISILIVLLICFNHGLSFAQEEIKIEACGKVSKMEGDSCATAKVELDLTNCEPSLKTVQATLRCSARESVATYQTKKYNYRLALETSQAWGKTSFAAKGKIWRAIRKSFLASHNVDTPKPTTVPPVAVVQEVKPREITKAVEESAPEEPAKTTYHASGVSWVEYESSDKFGFDGTSGRTSFSDSETQSTSQENMSLNLRLNLDAGIETSRIYSVLDVGDVYYGDTTSGGGVGQQKGDAIGLRNLYLSHKINENISFDTGVMPVLADPRAFVFSDDLAAFNFNYKLDKISTKVWVGEATRQRLAHSSGDRYSGIQSNIAFTENFNLTPFAIQRSVNGELFTKDLGGGTYNSSTGSTRSQYVWAGANAKYTVGEFSFDATGIHNSARTSFKNFNEKDEATSYLADLKIGYKPSGSRASFSLEGLTTPGAKNTTNSGNTIIGTRKGFASPVAASYLLTVATSDGVDEAPGSKKESVSAGSLASPEGLTLIVFNTQYDFTDTTSALVRYGHLTSAAESSNNSTQIGDEVDFQLTHKLDAKSLLQVDYGYFFAGQFYVNPKNAQLTSVRYRLEF